jgi:hypothetical protein
MTSGADGVNVKVVLVESRAMVPVTLGVTVKVLVSMVTGFIGLLNVTLISVVGQAVVDAIAGSTESTVGGLKGLVGPPVFLSESLHPAMITVNISPGIQNLANPDLLISIPLTIAVAVQSLDTT